MRRTNEKSMLFLQFPNAPGKAYDNSDTLSKANIKQLHKNRVPAPNLEGFDYRSLLSPETRARLQS